MDEYDPVTNSWASKAPMPTARQALAVAGASNGKIYAVGGVVGGGGSQPPLGTVEEYDPATNMWSVKAPMPTARYDLGLTCSSNGKLYAIGGNLQAGFSPGTTVEEYDPTTNSWSTKAPMPTARFGQASSRTENFTRSGGVAQSPTSRRWNSIRLSRARRCRASVPPCACSPSTCVAKVSAGRD